MKITNFSTASSNTDRAKDDLIEIYTEVKKRGLDPNELAAEIRDCGLVGNQWKTVVVLKPYYPGCQTLAEIMDGNIYKQMMV